VEATDVQLSAPRQLGFIGLGHSGRPDLSEHLGELRHERAEDKLSEHCRFAQG